LILLIFPVKKYLSFLKVLNSSDSTGKMSTECFSPVVVSVIFIRQRYEKVYILRKLLAETLRIKEIIASPGGNKFCRTCCTYEATSPGDMSVAGCCIPPAVPFGGAAVMGGDPPGYNPAIPGYRVTV